MSCCAGGDLVGGRVEIAVGGPVEDVLEPAAVVEHEDRFDYAAFLKRHGVQAFVNIVIPGADGRRPYGLLQATAGSPASSPATTSSSSRAKPTSLGPIERRACRNQLS